MNRSPLLVVIYDSITNSVFQSQVLLPLLKQRKEHPYQPITIISFEKKSLSKEHLKKIVPHQAIKVIIKKRSTFFPLWFAQKALRDFLHMIPEYQLLARGPHAGFICIKVADKRCATITIQARGLVAQEYWFVHQKNSLLVKLIHFLRFKQLQKLEKKCYSVRNPVVEIQAVSPALKEYLIKKHTYSTKKITIAHHDLPAKIQPAQVTQWKQEMRELLAIPQEAFVYCYNGSAKPWQCIDKVIAFFKEEMAQKEESFLLVLTQDTEQAKNKIDQQMIPKTKYKIISVTHHDIYKYLSAADAGLLFRDEHIINWVSRPTKLLEYQAVGLKVIHNDTIEYAKTK